MHHRGRLGRDLPGTGHDVHFNPPNSRGLLRLLAVFAMSVATLLVAVALLESPSGSRLRAMHSAFGREDSVAGLYCRLLIVVSPFTRVYIPPVLSFSLWLHNSLLAGATLMRTTYASESAARAHDNSSNTPAATAISGNVINPSIHTAGLQSKGKYICNQLRYPLRLFVIQSAKLFSRIRRCGAVNGTHNASSGAQWSFFFWNYKRSSRRCASAHNSCTWRSHRHNDTSLSRCDY